MVHNGQLTDLIEGLFFQGDMIKLENNFRQDNFSVELNLISSSTNYIFMKLLFLTVFLGLPSLAFSAEKEWIKLYNGRDLTGWQTTGNWLPQKDGSLLIQHVPAKKVGSVTVHIFGPVKCTRILCCRLNINTRLAAIAGCSSVLEI